MYFGQDGRTCTAVERFLSTTAGRLRVGFDLSLKVELFRPKRELTSSSVKTFSTPEDRGEDEWLQIPGRGDII